MEKIKIFAPVLIPTLNRYKHFRNCLESLEQCKYAELTDIYVALDYPLVKKHVDGWKQIDAYLKEKDVKADGYIELIGVLYKVEMESMMLHRTEQDVVNARKLTAIPVLNELRQKAELLLLACESDQETISDKLR